MRRAESIEFVADENGWEMHVTDEAGEVARFNIHGLVWNLPDHVDAVIGAWRREGLSAVGLCTPAEDELRASETEAYPPGDPKREAFQETDWDLLRDRAEGW